MLISILFVVILLSYSSVLAFFVFYAKEIGLANVVSFYCIIFAILISVSKQIVGRWFTMKDTKIINK